MKPQRPVLCSIPLDIRLHKIYTQYRFYLGTKCTARYVRQRDGERKTGRRKPHMDYVPLRERNRQRTFQQIIDAAFTLFRTLGYDQTTMDAIAEKAEVSRGTLFNYFPTKQALLIPFANRVYLERVQPEVQSYLNTQPTTFQALRF